MTSQSQKKANKNWYDKNKEYRKSYQKEYRQSEKYKKKDRIRGWKNRNVISNDFDYLYDKWLNIEKCEWCEVILNKKNLEHNHISGEVRGIVCSKCNWIMRKKDTCFKMVMEQLKNTSGECAS